MNLHGSIATLQNSGARLYTSIAQYFKENSLVRNIWLEMAHDKEQQVACLKSLPPRFWSELRHSESGLEEALKSCRQARCPGESEEHSLQKCFTQILEFEEPVILRVYAPIIRKLRTEWTDQALDFYIMVKAFVARLLRIVQSFSGDPVMIRRADSLLVAFEREVQARDLPATPAGPATLKERLHERHPAEAQQPARKSQSKSSSKSSLISERTKSIAARSMRLVKNIELSRRRARR